jgi:MFS family permease
MDLAYIVSAIMSVLGIFLLAMTYMYIDKLEKLGCACAEHKYKRFIKGYSIFAIVFLVITMVFPPAVAAKTFGTTVGQVYALISIPYYIATIIFFILALIYVRYLMREKCKCSEDVRREILYVWAILEIVLISAFFLIPLIGFVVAGSVAMVSSTIEKGLKSAPTIRDAAVNPLKSAMKVSDSLKDSVKKSLRKLK